MHLSQQEAREDIAQLAQTLATSHPDPYSAMGGPLTFHRKVARLLTDVPDEGVTDAKLLHMIRPFVASIKDGHTGLGYFSFDKKQMRFWLDWGIVEEQFYVSAVYQSEHQHLIGARLLSLDNISFEELVERMKEIRGYDNQYQNLINLLFSLSDPAFFLELLQRETPPQNVSLQLLLSDGTAQTITMALRDEPPGKRLEPLTRVIVPKLNAADMGWYFLDERQQVACLRVDSLMRYRETFEFWHAIGNDSSLNFGLNDTARQALPEQASLPESVEERIALVPAAIDLLRDLFKAMKEAQTPDLLVDLCACPGGSSFFSEILQYFLYGIEEMISIDYGYQVKRYSSLYFTISQNEHPDDPKFQEALLNDGYDFSDEVAWQRRQQMGMTDEERMRAFQEEKQYIDMMPTFLQEFEQGTWERSWTPRVTVLTAAHTSSAAFTVMVGLLRHGADTVGVPSSQAGNCFIDALPFTLKHSGIQGQLSFKWSVLFPNDPLRGKLLRPHRELTYQDLVAHTFDPNTIVLLALERLASEQ